MSLIKQRGGRRTTSRSLEKRTWRLEPRTADQPDGRISLCTGRTATHARAAQWRRINISSVHEQIAWGGYSAYAASKAGLSMVSKTLAQEAGPFGRARIVLAPGRD